MTQRLDAYLEAGVGAHVDDAVVAWAFDLDLWGTCGQGLQETTAVAALEHAAAHAGGAAQRVVVVERIHGDERPFARDQQPATPAERAQTLATLRAARRQTLALVSACPDAVLDWDDPQRVLPPWASWRTLRQMAWHERGELVVMRRLAERARRHLPGP